MKDRSAIQERYLRDTLPVRLGGLAANLSRIKSFAAHDASRDADHRRDRTFESGVQPGPIRTDPEVKAGVVGLGDEKISERRRNETEKAKTSGEQRQSGCQKTKNGG
jgi:hypothetical protein